MWHQLQSVSASPPFTPSLSLVPEEAEQERTVANIPLRGPGTGDQPRENSWTRLIYCGSQQTTVAEPNHMTCVNYILVLMIGKEGTVGKDEFW